MKIKIALLLALVFVLSVVCLAQAQEGEYTPEEIAEFQFSFETLQGTFCLLITGSGVVIVLYKWIVPSGKDLGYD